VIDSTSIYSTIQCVIKIIISFIVNTSFNFFYLFKWYKLT